ncbi:MAG: winged helix-turn-helix domain-containing protein [Acidobacteriota bacterium]|nr:winged helix-turn-helix domain-containing protein [Acidobacteriota bacterium]
MLEPLLGNNTIEKILFALESYGQAYPLELSKMFDIAVNGIQQQMDRLENGGVIVSSKVGRTRLYQFNPRYPFLRELRALIRRAMEFLSEKELKKYYRRRTRPRKKSKPI